ncbi:Uncharacterised protein at_DN0794, partial [Pycnogonum litorale]
MTLENSGKSYPFALVFPSSLSIIPNTPEWQITIKFVKYQNITFTRLIKVKTSTMDQENFFRIQLENTFFSQAYRENRMECLEITPMEKFPDKKEIGMSVIQAMSVTEPFEFQL